MKASLMDLVKPVLYSCAPLSDTAAHVPLQQIQTKPATDD